jgi:2-succinyl-6-hydroxy-2,4-cyclohexadiene-1-carboxylate synthase
MKLVFERWGHGSRPVLLLHGFTGNRHTWNRVRPALEPHVAALAVDLPGHGESSLPRGSGRDGFLETLEALAELMQREGSGPVDVVGYSQGARIALALAVHHPQQVRRLVLESGSPGLHARKLRSERRAEDEVRARAIETSGVEAFLEGWERLPLFDGLRRLPPAEQQALRARRAGQTAEGLAGALRTLGTGVQPDYWPSLPHLRCPALLLTGREDAKYTAIARTMAAELPIVWRHAVADCGHAPHLEAPEVWCSEVLGFLSTPWYEAQVEVEAATGSRS